MVKRTIERETNTVTCKRSCSPAQIETRILIFRISSHFFTFSSIPFQQALIHLYLRSKIMEDRRALPPWKRELAKALIVSNMSIQQTADEVECARHTITKYRRNLRFFGDCLAPSISRNGRPPALTQEILDVHFFSLLSLVRLSFNVYLGTSAVS